MKLNELKTQYNLKEEHMILLFDVLYTYHKFDTLYSFEELEVFFNGTKYFEQPEGLFLKALTAMIEMDLLTFVNDRGAKFFIPSEEIREIELFKELETEVC
ncbi:hypothetical protein [Bacillus altitudinis]|uniref:hypothetical protein n=1 Tax=Bacillus altitudinis TaxID=293387 RepID=UPI002100E76D|nr:hypothetical protein [Bacillus altitudinis]UTV31682.1 hypothetical protein NM966_12850 [Bacillus altitudinis]